jgi:Leucine Rich repeat
MDEATLEFEGPLFTDTSLMAIANLENIEALSLLDTAVTDDGFGELLRAQALVEISIISDELSGYALWVLSQLPALRSLQIHHGPRIGDSGMQNLSRCVSLCELYLRETAVTDGGLAHIGELPRLWSLILDDTNISDEGCMALAGMPQLSLLSLCRTRVSGHGLAAVRNNEHFNLYLEETPATDASVIALAERLSNLKLISLNQTAVGDAAALALAKLQRLDDVRLSGTKLTQEGLAAFTGHPTLNVIYVEGCDLTKKAVGQLKKASPRKLTVYGP